ncbi:MAG TPA: NAD-dependent epimerase/dehydratase family protein [Armatimonadota bacterium]|nr:NAD-dependent epimerase/dehydratase family protein [Armatimonadota bacterium]
MRILVSGGAGFIGSNIVDAYIRYGHTVAVVDNLSTGLSENLNPDAQFYQADIRNSQEMAKVFDDFQPQIVNHHAAQIDVRKSTSDPLFDADVNIIGSLNIMKASAEHHVKKLIYPSSGGAVYGDPEYLPADERHPIRPIAEYGVSKHIVEHYLYVYGSNYDLNYSVLRYANVYGPRQNVHGEAGVIAIFIGKLLSGEQPTIFGDGNATRDYVYVEDVVRANVLALDHGDRTIINIGTGIETSVNAIFSLISNTVRSSIPPAFESARVGEISRTFLSNHLAEKLLGWKPLTTIEDGIQKTVDHVKVVV